MKDGFRWFLIVIALLMGSAAMMLVAPATDYL
jgi:hypothetical protein